MTLIFILNLTTKSLISCWSGCVVPMYLKPAQAGLVIQLFNSEVRREIQRETKRDRERQRETERDKVRQRERKQDRERQRKTERDIARQRET